MTAPLTRFAPAPTGFLHIGHVVNTIFVWGLAHVRDARVVLRIEDHDRQRCRPEYERALLEDLKWLGFQADAMAPRQSDRDAAYREAVAPLISAGLVYGCDCSRKQLEGTVYPGRCRDRGIPLTEGVGWRLRVSDGAEVFDDLLIGRQTQSPAAQVGDFLIRDRVGNWTYQWAATTDDTLQGVTLIIRGLDLLDSTGRQLYLARLLGRHEPPLFAHHPLVMKSPTQKVSKSDGDTGVRDLRAAGWSAERVIGHAAWTAGLTRADTPLAAADVARLFR